MSRPPTSAASGMTSGSQFNGWLQELGTTYQTLNSFQRNQTLDYLIDVSDGSQLFHLAELLNNLLKRDFIAQLPRELADYILCYLDAGTLLLCCSVSRKWAEIINSCVEVWKQICVDSGLAVPDNVFDASFFKKLYFQCSRRLHSLDDGRAFEQKILFGHMDRVMAVYYRDGRLATGSDDHSVRVWDCDTGRCLKVVQTHTVADVKFDDERILTASFDTTAACWDMATCQLQVQFSGHVAAVFSIDYDPDLNLLITGSADSTVKIWRLREGSLIRTLPQHRSTWIMQVRLSSQASDGFYFILSRDNVSIHLWKLDKSSHDILVMEEWQNPYNDLVPGMQVLPNNKVSFAGVDTQNTCYVIQNDLTSPPPDGAAAGPGPPLSVSQRVSYKIIKDSFAQAFLGSGSHYDVVLTQGDQAAVDIVAHHAGNELVASIRLPSDYRQSKRGSTFTLGDRSWLDGFDGKNDRGVFFITSLRDNSIMMLRWTHIGENIT